MAHGNSGLGYDLSTFSFRLYCLDENLEYVSTLQDIFFGGKFKFRAEYGAVTLDLT